MKSRRCRRRYKPILQFISVYTYQPWEYLFISDQYDNQFFSDLSRCIHESDSMKMAMYQLHSLLKSRDAWQVILLWEWNPNKEALHCIEIISDPSEFLEAFKTTSASLSACYLTPAIPFHAFKEKRGVIAYDLKDDPRYEIAQKAGIESGLVIPIFNHSQASCVLEIYKKGALDASNESQLQTLMYWIQLQYEIFFKHLLIEKQLKAQRKVLDSMVDAVYSCDMQGNIQTWSKGCELIYKWTEAEIIGKSIKTFIPDKEKDYFDFLLQNFSQGKPIVHIETNAVNKNGEIFVIHTTYTMERNDKHELIGVAISAHDATCQAREKEAIKKIEEKLKNVVENIQEWVWEVDDQSRIVYSNHLVTNFLGFSIEEVLDKEISSLLLEQKDLEYFKSNKPWENQVIQMRGKNNQVCQLECSAVPFRLDNYSDKMGLRLAARDITERIRLEKMKEEFISMISHELRTPLSAIIAALDLLKSGGIPKENSQEVLDILIKNSHLLKELIDNILIVQTAVPARKIGTT
ncbi:MAG: PAS domain S-box protein [Simkaniaceae bacterium]|nr:PAS domain S-box protein [Simkaniaceae bacterium]